MTLDNNPQLFGKRYARFLRLLELVTLYLPQPFRWPLAGLFCRFFSPYNGIAEEIAATIGRALNLDKQAAHHAWKRWRASHARFVLGLFHYRQMDSEWMRSAVQVERPELLEKITRTGGLILTYHTHHQNTFAASLGIAGSIMSPVAASATGSPLYSDIGRYIDIMNNDSQQHFRGGCYIYTDNLREVLVKVKARLQRGELVLSLCDFHQPSTEREHQFLGRTLTPPTGVIRLALKSDVPIYLGLLFPGPDGRHKLLLADTKGRELDSVIEEYLEFLEQTVRSAPEAWQGWEWYGHLPESVPAEKAVAS